MDAAYDKVLDAEKARLAEEWSRRQSGNTLKDMNASNACSRRKGKDVDYSGNQDLDMRYYSCQLKEMYSH